MKFEHNQVCTKDGIVEVGKSYQYKEEGSIFTVGVTGMRSDEAGIGFDLVVINVVAGRPPVQKNFSCWAAHGRYAYSGMWRIYDAGKYGNEGGRTVMTEQDPKTPAEKIQELAQQHELALKQLTIAFTAMRSALEEIARPDGIVDGSIAGRYKEIARVALAVVKKCEPKDRHQ
jgi:hypothetical protein